MTLAELIAAFRALPPGDQRRFLAEVLEPRTRGRPRKTAVGNRIERVHKLAKELGSKERAFKELRLADGKQPESVKRQYNRDTRRFLEIALGDDIK